MESRQIEEEKKSQEGKAELQHEYDREVDLRGYYSDSDAILSNLTSDEDDVDNIREMYEKYNTTFRNHYHKFHAIYKLMRNQGSIFTDYHSSLSEVSNTDPITKETTPVIMVNKMLNATRSRIDEKLRELDEMICKYNSDSDSHWIVIACTQARAISIMMRTTCRQVCNGVMFLKNKKQDDNEAESLGVEDHTFYAEGKEFIDNVLALLARADVAIKQFIKKQKNEIKPEDTVEPEIQRQFNK
jgi:hypothetical protein